MSIGKAAAFFLAVLMLASCLTAGGCSAPAAVQVVSDSRPAPFPLPEPTASYSDVPEAYWDLFEGGSFNGDGVWLTDDERYDEIAAKLHDVCEKNMNGSVLLATDDKVIFAGGFAGKEIDGVTPLNPFTTYEIGSVTKQFTAVAVLQQVQAGKIDVSDTIDRYFPDYPYGGQITVDQLLHMDSGIPDMLNKPELGAYLIGNEAFMNGTMSDEELLDFISGHELSFDYAPGVKYAYSNTNYWLLALILEQVTGQSYAEYIKENIFDVCHMPCSSACATGDLTSRPWQGDEYMTVTYCCRGAGDIHSSVCDILRWNRTLFSGWLLDEAQMEYMLSFRNDYSCGWVDVGGGAIAHSGGTWGYVTENRVYRTADGENLYLVLMSSHMAAAGYGISKIINTMDDIML